MKNFSLFNKNKNNRENKKVTEKPKDSYHTYFTDVLKKKGEFDEGAVAKKLREDQRLQKQKERLAVEKRATIGWIVLSIFLIIGSFFVIVSVINAITPEPIKQAEAVNSYIRADAYATVNLNNITSINDQIKKSIDIPPRSQSFSVLEMKLDNRNFAVNSLGRTLGWTVSSDFYSSVNPFFTYGWFFKNKDEISPFIIFRINSISDIRKLIEPWHQNMPKEFAPILNFGWNDSGVNLEGLVIDKRLFNNQEITTFSDQDELILAYTIIGNKYLVISTDQSVLSLISRRFSDLN